MSQSRDLSYRTGYLYYFKATTSDVFVAMLMGWKLFGGADISWWLVFVPWLIGGVAAAVYATAREMGRDD